MRDIRHKVFPDIFKSAKFSDIVKHEHRAGFVVLFPPCDRGFNIEAASARGEDDLVFLSGSRGEHGRDQRIELSVSEDLGGLPTTRLSSGHTEHPLQRRIDL